MGEFDKKVIAEFLEEHWVRFVAHLEIYDDESPEDWASAIMSFLGSDGD